MKKCAIWMAFAMSIVLLLACVSGAAETEKSLTLATGGETEYHVVTSNPFRKADENLELFNEFCEILHQYTGAEFSFGNAVNQLFEKEIFLGYAQETGKHEERLASGDVYTLDPKLVGQTGWAVRTYGESIAILTVETTGSDLARKAYYYFLTNALNYTPDTVPATPLDTVTIPAVNYVFSEYLHCDQLVPLTIDGTDIREFVLVVPDGTSSAVAEKALAFRRIIFALTGSDIGMKSPAEAMDAIHTIRFGTGDWSGTDAAVKVENGTLTFSGDCEESLFNAVDVFCRNTLHVCDTYYVGDYSPISVTNTDSAVGAFFHAENERVDIMPIFANNLADLLGTADTVCFSDASIIDRLYSVLTADSPAPGSTVYLICNTSKWCSCDACQSKTDAYFKAVNEIAKKLSSDHITLATLAYRETATAPSFPLENNVLVYFAMPELCCAHTIDADNCDTNHAIAENLKAWRNVAHRLYVLDFSQDYVYYASTFPNYHTIAPNYSYYRENTDGVIYVWDSKAAVLEYGEYRIRYLASLLCEDDLSENTSADLSVKILKELYGPDSDAMQEYMAIFTEASSDHFTIRSTPAEILPVSRDEAGKYDLTTARKLYDIWKRVYRRHDSPTEELTGFRAAFFAESYHNADYYYTLHSRVQFTVWLRHAIYTPDIVPVIAEMDGATLPALT